MQATNQFHKTALMQATKQFRIRALSLAIMAALGSSNVYALDAVDNAAGIATSLNTGGVTDTSVGNGTGATTITGSTVGITGNTTVTGQTTTAGIGNTGLLANTGDMTNSGTATIDGATKVNDTLAVDTNGATAGGSTLNVNGDGISALSSSGHGLMVDVNKLGVPTLGTTTLSGGGAAGPGSSSLALGDSQATLSVGTANPLAPEIAVVTASKPPATLLLLRTSRRAGGSR